MKRSGQARGFTLIELMLVVAIIAVLAVIAIPKFANLIAKSALASTRGNLGAMRSALSIYYADMEGSYPTDNLNSLVAAGKYMRTLPSATAYPESHLVSNSVNAGSSVTAAMNDLGGWAYDNNNGDSSWGAIYVNCSMTDANGTLWTIY